jgi:hypothetical protein
MRSASASPLGTEFDDFLFASIGEDRNDMPLSVVSALARLDVDPWREAASLAQLPKAIATERLASLIAALADGLSARPDSGAIAARLIALLPRQFSPAISSREAWFGLYAGSNSRVVLYVIFMILVLSVQFFIVGHQPSTQVSHARAWTSSTVVPQTPPADSGQ